MRGPDDIVERIRNAVSIVDVVGAHVRLRKRGRNYIGLCPFHSEKTPSFNVLDDKGIFKCFGCGEGGDVFAFVMKLEGLTFPETLEKLATQAGIEYKPKERRADEEPDKTEALGNACRDYAAHCYRSLHSGAGAGAMKYLRDRRFSDETLKRFGVGFSPEGGDSFLSSKEHSVSSLQLYEQAGIILRGISGDPYDRFHGRVIFPIYSPTGKIIGFGGRIMPTDTQSQLAKYVNSPETPLYHKSHVLYGLFQAKDAIRKQDYAILVEGYADVIALSQAGFQNVVAASGTSLTTDQLNLLRRYTKQIVLLFDADTAGKNAALRGIELALAADFDVSTVVLPPGEDPDSFIRDKGAAAFAEELERRTSFVETKARLLRESGAFETPEGSARAVRSIVETIAKVNDPIKREFFVRKIAEKFRLMESMLLEELRKIRRSDETRERRYTEREKAQEFSKPETQVPKPETGIASAVLDPASPPREAEVTLLRSFLDNTQIAYKAAIEMDFDFTLVKHPLVQSIVMMTIREYEESGSSPAVATLIEDFADDPAAKTLILDGAANRIHISEEWVDAAPNEREIADAIRLTVHQSCIALTQASLEEENALLSRRLMEDMTPEEEAVFRKDIELLNERKKHASSVRAGSHLKR